MGPRALPDSHILMHTKFEERILGEDEDLETHF